MKEYVWTAAIGMVIACTAGAQDFNNYEPVRASGKLPDEVVTRSSIKYREEIAQLKEDRSSSVEKRDKRGFYLQTNFTLDDLLLSGLVLFNDPLTAYITDVLAEVVKGEPEVMNRIRVYTLRSSAVNAFATGRGEIFVTMGLLAQLENEAQLAYILAHELAHVEEGHNLELFLEAQRLERDLKRSNFLNQSDFDAKVISVNRYSREMEKDADASGLKRMLQSGYALDNLNTVYDVLKYSYLPFEDLAFPRDYFNDDLYKIPDEYWLEEVNPIVDADEFEENQKSTHPSIGSRRNSMEEQIRLVSSEGRSDYLVSEERFRQVRQVARFELPMIQFRLDNPVEALYSAYVLLHEYPESKYLHTIIGKALYVTAKLKHNSGRFEENPEFLRNQYIRELEGESHQVYNLLNTLPSKELVILALRYNWDLFQRYSDDEELEFIVRDLFIELAASFDKKSEFVSMQDLEALESQELEEEQEEVGETASKYDKIRAQRKKPRAKPGQEYWRVAFASYLEDSEFTAYFEKGQQIYANRLESQAKRRKSRKEQSKENKRQLHHGKSLGIDRIVLVTPTYRVQKARKSETTTKFVAAESRQTALTQHYREIAERLPLEVEILDVNGLGPNDMERFNDLRYLREWFQDQMVFEDLSVTMGYEQRAITAIADKYGTDYFLWTGTATVVKTREGKAANLIGSLALPVFLPYTIYYALTNERYTLMYALLFDVREGRWSTLKFDIYKGGDSRATLRSHVYDTLLQINRKP